MQEFSIADLPTELPRFLAVVAQGESVTLLENGQLFAVVSPGQPETQASDLPSFAEAMVEYRQTHDVIGNGVTNEEVASWRDKSIGREPPF